MILVTGGLGYIGSHLVNELTRQGYETIVLDNQSNAYVEASDLDAKVELGDIQKPLDSIFRKYQIDTVIHLASLTSVPVSVDHPFEYYTANVGGTLNLLNYMRKYKVNRILFASTGSIYGDGGPFHETDTPNPTNPYARSKVMIENILTESDFDALILRYFNVIGTHLKSYRWSPHLYPSIMRVLNGEQRYLKIFGDGLAVRDYIHIDDLVQAHIKLLLHSEPNHVVYNIASGVGKSVLDVVSEFEAEIPLKFSERRAGDVQCSLANVSRYRREFE